MPERTPIDPNEGNQPHPDDFSPLVRLIALEEPESSKKFYRFLNVLRTQVTVEDLLLDRLAQANVSTILGDFPGSSGASSREAGSFGNPYPTICLNRTGADGRPAGASWEHRPFMLKDDDDHFYYFSLWDPSEEVPSFLRPEDVVAPEDFSHKKFPKHRSTTGRPFSKPLQRIAVTGGKAQLYNYNTDQWETSPHGGEYEGVNENELEEANRIVETAAVEPRSDLKYEYHPANEALRYRFDPQNQDVIIPPIPEMLERLDDREKSELMRLVTTKWRLVEYFENDPTASLVEELVLTEFDESNSHSADRRVLGIPLVGYLSWAFSNGPLPTIPELRIMLSDANLTVEDFIEGMPQKAVGKFFEEPEASTALQKRLSGISTEKIPDSELGELPKLLQLDYRIIARQLLSGVRDAHPTRANHVNSFLNKAKGLAKAGGFELDQEEVQEALSSFHARYLEHNLALARDSIHDSEMIQFSGGLGPHALEVLARYIDPAIESAEILGDDTSFVKEFFEPALPEVLARIQMQWQQVQNSASFPDAYRNTMEEYEKAKTKVRKWAQASSMSIEDEIRTIERTVRFSNN